MSHVFRTIAAAALALAAGPAAAAPDDVAVTALGAQGVYNQGLGTADADTLVSERLRWTLGEGNGTRTLLLADARLTLDPVADDPWEQHRVRTLGVEVGSERWTVQLGRHAVYRGGPRLVDGLQVLHRPGGDWTVGAWAGLAPDLFTTRPFLRPGGGPIVAWERPTAQASIVGEVLGAAGGLDRAGVLGQLRFAPSQKVEISSRLDAQLADAEGRMGLADASVFARWRPAKSVDLDALYDAYSSLRYLQTAQLDPDLQRFASRIEALGLGAGITQDTYDPSLYQLFGLGGAWQARALVAPRLSLTSRYRYHPRVEDRYARVVPQAGLLGLGDGRLDLLVDAAWTWRGDTGSREEAGLNLVLDPFADGRMAFDGSARILIDPDFGGKPGWYADLFVDVAALDGTVVVGGISATKEPSDVTDLGVGGFLRVQHWLRPGRERR